AGRDYDLRVFDRWGTEVFQADQPTIGWDGRVNGAPPVTGVYVWKLRVRNAVDRLMREYTGHVTVLPCARPQLGQLPAPRMRGSEREPTTIEGQPPTIEMSRPLLQPLALLLPCMSMVRT